MSKDDRELIEAFDMAHQLIQEAKGIAGFGSVTDHLDEAENWIDKIATRLEALQAQPVGGEGPCPDGEHCCCCGPGDTCCDCGLKLIDLEREVALARWTDFLDMNPDDLTSPEDLPDHALVTFEQFYEMARDVLPRIPAALTASPPVVEREAIDRALILAVEDAIDQPPRLYDIEPMEVRDYRHSLYRIWSPLRDAILALTPVEGVGEKLGDFRCHNCKRVIEDVAAAPARCPECRCRDFAVVAPSTPVAQGDEVRPLADAPKDGSYFLILGTNFDGGAAVVHWDDGLEWWQLDDGKNPEIALRAERGLTGWMPLPAALTKGARDAG